ncbi:Amino-acid permease RocC [Sporomusa ovata DSM 2662]|uniref:Histidine transport protein (Permease) n=2 Tax=Sporomusa ovata TaxID=2378 RepID=A0A0U1L7S7_9FIRM|nr:amino-acid permease RocC [Sporomusa ovata DSM 2662]CQR74924.1 Histidine transport protein (permease) [Sporomusa ovata]
MEEQDTKRQLNRGLKSRHLQMIALGGIIGSGYFLGSGYVVGKAGPASVLAYLLGGLIVYAVMVCLGELAVARPIAGSFISYTRDYISPAWACGVGWCYWLTWVTYVPSEMIAAGIIMNGFFPAVSAMWWAVLFGLAITFINLSRVNLFGELEFWLALFKIVALLIFCGLAIMIFFGAIGGGDYLGTSVLLSNGGFAPKGYWAVLLTMVIVLVNFQGSEIIGLAAAESKEPAKTIPSAIKQITMRIISLYIIPMLLLVTIFPWDKASLETSVFAAALSAYNLEWAGTIFSFVVLTAAISCSNSGLYGCTRAIYALAQEKMAPEFLGRLNSQGVPQNATALSIVVCWLGVVLYTFDQDQSIYTYLLALSGFTGAISWISICWSQYNFRKQLSSAEVKKLKYKAPLFPYITQFGIWAQIACLIFVAFTEELRTSLYLGVPLLILPIIIYRWTTMRKEAVTES